MVQLDLASEAFVALCAFNVWAGWCRIVAVSERSTRPDVRRAMVTMTLAYTATVFGVLFWAYTPEWPAALIPLAQAAFYIATRHAWKSGIPPGYRLTGDEDAP